MFLYITSTLTNRSISNKNNLLQLRTEGNTVISGTLLALLAVSQLSVIVTKAALFPLRKTTHHPLIHVYFIKVNQHGIYVSKHVGFRCLGYFSIVS